MVNKVILVGRLGGDPDIRYVPSGSAVATVSLATSEKWKDRETGEKVERTEWHRLVFWNKLAEIVGEYLTKGSLIYVEGSLHTRSWETDDGVKKYATDVKVREMKMLGSKNSGSSEFRSGGAYEPPPSGGAPAFGGDSSGDDVPDDDIPF